MVAVDGEYIYEVDMKINLTKLSEVAIIPPISGG
jgi:molybdopterin converting factor small subunit